MRLIHHGGHHGVTGSCHELRLDNGGGVLIDCGVFQGEDARLHPDLHVTFPVDQQNLVNFVRRMRYLPGRVRLVHGEPPAKRALQEKLERIGVRVG